MEGQEFGRYRLTRLIGSGGMGDVYEALDVDRDRRVALKLLPERFEERGADRRSDVYSLARTGSSSPATGPT